MRKLASAKQRQPEIRGKIARLLQMVTNGLMSDDDPDLAAQLRVLKSQREQVAQEVSLLEQAVLTKTR